MLEKEILKLLQKISKQLETISSTQANIEDEISRLNKEVTTFQHITLRNLVKNLPEKVQRE